MLLLIDTSGETASVIFSRDGIQLGSSDNTVARDHSAWLHPAIQQLLKETKVNIREIQAVAVLAGPGSYTGLRVGMAAAKGFCVALGVPLITCNNLLLMASSMVTLTANQQELLCPMIDARRQEVFTALYTYELDVVRSPGPLILDKTSFERELSSRRILFCGTGAAKWQEICKSSSAGFAPQPFIKEPFVNMATDYFNRNLWANTVYSEPEYGKEFHTHVEN